MELLLNAIDLVPRGFRLLVIQLLGSGARQPALHAVHNCHHHFQIAQQLGARSGRSFLLRLPLRFEKQLGIIEDAFADRGRTSAPSGIQLAGFTRIAVMLSEDRRHPLAVLQVLPCHWHQKLQRHLRRDRALAHLLLNSFRQDLHQRQPPRYPAHAAIEPPRQLIQPIAKTLLQLLKQPTNLQGGFVFG